MIAENTSYCFLFCFQISMNVIVVRVKMQDIVKISSITTNVIAYLVMKEIIVKLVSVFHVCCFYLHIFCIHQYSCISICFVTFKVLLIVLFIL